MSFCLWTIQKETWFRNCCFPYPEELSKALLISNCCCLSPAFWLQGDADLLSGHFDSCLLAGGSDAVVYPHADIV